MRRTVPAALVGVVAVVSLLAGCGGAEPDRSAASPRADSASLTGERAERTESGGANPSAQQGETAPELSVAEFAVEGMTCGGCAIATEMAVKELDGVVSADAEYDETTGEGRCRVEYDPRRVDPERMMAAIRKAGFEPRLREEGSG